jgi:hypothetical protein
MEASLDACRWLFYCALGVWGFGAPDAALPRGYPRVAAKQKSIAAHGRNSSTLPISGFLIVLMTPGAQPCIV